MQLSGQSQHTGTRPQPHATPVCGPACVPRTYAHGRAQHPATALAFTSDTQPHATTTPSTYSPACAPRGSRGRHPRLRSHVRPQASGRPSSTDLQLDLWNALVTAGSQKLTDMVQSALGVTQTNLTRVQRLVEPPPAGYPPGPSGDQVLSLVGDPLTFLTQTQAEYGNVVGLLMGGERVVLVCGSEAAKEVMIDQSEVFVKKGTAFFPGSSLAGNGLLVSDGDVWTRQRRLSNPAFRRTMVDTYAASMVTLTQQMTRNRWRNGEIRDVYSDFNELTLQITLDALFGSSLDGPPPPPPLLPPPPSPTPAPTSRNTTPQTLSAQRSPSPPPQHASQHGDTTASEHDQLAPASTHQTATMTLPAPQAHTSHLPAADASPSATSTFAKSAKARRIVSAIERAFDFFTRRAGASMMLPEWLPTWDNLEFASSVAQLDKVVYGIISERRQQLSGQRSSTVAAMSRSPSPTPDSLMVASTVASANSQPTATATSAGNLTPEVTLDSEINQLRTMTQQLNAETDRLREVASFSPTPACMQQATTTLSTDSPSSSVSPSDGTASASYTTTTTTTTTVRSPDTATAQIHNGSHNGSSHNGNGSNHDSSFVRSYSPSPSPHASSTTSPWVTSAGRQDLLQSLLTAVDEDGSVMDDVSLRDELMTLLIAGQETSAILLGWACALLAHHRDVQAALVAEVHSVLGTERAPSAQDARQLRLTERVVLEALRLYSPAYLVGRCASRDTTLGPDGRYRIEAGTTVLISPYLMHRDRGVWGPDAGEFKPDRWLEVQDQPGYGGFMTVMSNLGHNGSYLPFGGGPRNCIGTGFAMVEAILVLAAVVQQYDLQPASGPATPFPAPKPLLTLRPEAVNLRLVRRM